MKLESLKDLYLEQLRDLYSAETQLVEALPKMAEAASLPELRKGFTDHLKQTEGHVQRLEKIFKSLDEDPDGQTCAGMKGLIKEGSEMIKTKGEPEVIDAGLIAAAQRVEHYEMAGYGTVCTYAETLGHADHQKLLEATLEEEKATDEKLSKLAVSKVNASANAQPVAAR
jgi:ferritin-like metal-binding protein YciE